MRTIEPKVGDVWKDCDKHPVEILKIIEQTEYPIIVYDLLASEPQLLRRCEIISLIERDGMKVPGPGDWCSSKMWGLMTGNELELFNRYDEIIANGDNECAKMEDGLPWLRLDQKGELPKAQEKPAEKKTTIKRFKIFRDDMGFGIANKHGGMPYIIARNDQGTPLKYFQDRELIHGYIYNFDGCEYTRCDAFAFCGTNDVGDRAISAVILKGDKFKRILPVAVLVEVEE